MSFVPLGSMLQPKKKTLETRAGACRARIKAVHAPSLQPTIAALSNCNASITARTSDAINSYVKGRKSRVLRPWPRLSISTARWPEPTSIGT